MGSGGADASTLSRHVHTGALKPLSSMRTCLQACTRTRCALTTPRAHATHGTCLQAKIGKIQYLSNENDVRLKQFVLEQDFPEWTPEEVYKLVTLDGAAARPEDHGVGVWWSSVRGGCVR